MDTVALRQNRATLVAQGRQILDAADAQKRGMTQEEQNQWDAIMADVDRLEAQIKREERQSRVESDLEQRASEPARPAAGDGKPDIPQFRSRGMQNSNADVDWQNDPEWRRLLQMSQPDYRTAFKRHMIRGEQRALQMDLGASGGYLVLPLQLADQLLTAVDDQVFMRQWANVMAVPNAESLGVPTLEADPADADWTTELGTGSEDSTMSFGRRELHPHPVGKRIKISRSLLRKAPGAENLVMNRMAYKFAITQEKGFLTGTGVQQPLGVFVASNDGIPTTRDVSTDNTATAFTADGLINAKYTLKAAYWPRARWIFHRDAVKMLRKLKDGDGQYIWDASIQVDQPDMLLGNPVAVSEYAPNTFTASQYVGVLGDFSNYWIADSMQIEMQRLVELYAATNQVALIGRMETDGQPVLAEAFVRVKLGS